jgi:hypothetical protein
MNPKPTPDSTEELMSKGKQVDPEQMVGISKSLAVIKTLKVTLNGHDDSTEQGKKNANGKEARRSLDER